MNARSVINIYDDSTPEHAHLRCGKPDTLSHLKGLRHIIKESMQPFVKLFNRLTYLMKCFVTLVEYLS